MSMMDTGVSQGGPALWRAAADEQPIFFDPAGRRGRVISALGALAAAAVAAALLLIVTGAIGFATVPSATPLSLTAGARPAEPAAVSAALVASVRHAPPAHAVSRGALRGRSARTRQTSTDRDARRV